MAYPTSGGRTLGFPGTISAGASVGATNNNGLPGGLITYCQITTNSSALGGGLNSISGLSATVTPTTTRMFKVTLQAAYFAVGGTGTVTADLVIYNNTAASSVASVVIANSVAVRPADADSTHIFVGNLPGATCTAYVECASATNFIGAIQSVAGSGSPTLAVGATAATNAFRGAWLMVEDCGPGF